MDPAGVSAEQLTQIVRTDRIARRMTWPAYGAFLGVPHTTIYKIGMGRVGRPHELTKVQILERINQVPVPARAGADSTGGADRGTTTKSRKRSGLPVVSEGRPQ